MQQCRPQALQRAAWCQAAAARRPAALRFGRRSLSAGRADDAAGGFRISLRMHGAPAAAQGAAAEEEEEDGKPLREEELDFDASAEFTDEAEGDSDVEDADFDEEDDEDEPARSPLRPSRVALTVCSQEEEDYEPTCTTGGVAWGATALAAARSVLAAPPFAGVFVLYSFRVHAAQKRIVVRLDKPAESFGSPTIDELAAFSTALDAALDAASVAADELTVEVSSAGAERRVAVPGELRRFGTRPMRVAYRAQPSGALVSDVLKLVEVGTEAATWRLADVKANRAHLKKGQPLSKKAKEALLSIPFTDIREVSLHVDV